MILKKEHANKLLNIKDCLVLNIPDDEFSGGDTLILFNNSDQVLQIKSNVKNTYASGVPGIVQKRFFPPRCIINAIFIDKDTLVLTKGES